MSAKRRCIIAIFSLLLCIGISFAWINDLQAPSGRYMEFVFKDGNAAISANDIEVKLYRDLTGDDDFAEINADSSDGGILNISDFAPGSRQKFRADIVNQNENGVSLSLRIVLSDVVCENTDMQKYLEIGANGFENFPDTVMTPSVRSRTLDQGLDGGSFVLIDSVEIPPNNGEPVSIYFYVMFSRTATEVFADQQFTIGSINFIAV